jgi:hypothetical protein
MQADGTCDHGHNNWHIYANNRRRCLTCKHDNGLQYRARQKAMQAPKTPIWAENGRIRNNGAGLGPDYTYTLSEILKARGYL